MKCKNGYKHDKPKFLTGNWLKRYFEKHTCRKTSMTFFDKIIEQEKLKGNDIMNHTKIETTIDILFFAFRYALSRKTGMYMFLIPELEKHKEKFRQDEIQQIINEIEIQNKLYDINREWIEFANNWKKKLK